MNSTTPRLDTAHPPCPRTIDIPTDTSTLALSDRLSLRIGLWLLLRAQRPQREKRAPGPSFVPPTERPTTEREAFALLTYDLQRQLR